MRCMQLSVLNSMKYNICIMSTQRLNFRVCSWKWLSPDAENQNPLCSFEFTKKFHFRFLPHFAFARLENIWLRLPASIAETPQNCSNWFRFPIFDLNSAKDSKRLSYMFVCSSICLRSFLIEIPFGQKSYLMIRCRLLVRLILLVVPFVLVFFFHRFSTDVHGLDWLGV